MNYIIYPKEQKTSYTRGKEITQSVLMSNTIFSILNRKGKLYPQNKNVHSLFLWSRLSLTNYQ